MRKTSIIILLPLIFLLEQHKKNTNYIMLESRSAGVDKPVTMLVFALDTFAVSDTFFGVHYKVNKCEFLSIKNAIEESQVSMKIDTTTIGYYTYTIVSNGKKTLYKTFNKEKTNILFNEILEQIKKSIFFKSVKANFDNILDRIK